MGRVDRMPAVVWLATAMMLGIVVLSLAPQVSDRGADAFFGPSDPRFFRAVAEAPFGDGATLAAAGHADEASYRYGRIGYPLAGWLAAAGRPGLVGWTLATVNLIALAAVPLLAARLVGLHGGDARAGVLVLLAPGLLLLSGRAYAEPLALALVLAGFVLAGLDRVAFAAAVFAFAVLTRETAALALLPLAFAAVRRGDRRRAAAWLAALMPFLAWSVWVRARVGEFPFLADTISRRDALRPPLVGLLEVASDPTVHDRGAVVAIAIASALFAIVAGVACRDRTLGAATVLFGVLALCVGPNTLLYAGETLRLLVVAQVLGIVCVATAVRATRPAAVEPELTRAG